MTTEELKKAKECKSAEELMALAKENNIKITEEQAKEYFAKLNPANGEITDDELDNVAGGTSCGDASKCPKCGCTKAKSSYTMRDGGLYDSWVCAQCGDFIKWRS